MTTPLAPGSLDGRVALVTGSSRGIGADTVRYLAGAGAVVVVNYRSKAPRAEKVVTEVTEAGGRAIAVGADLTDAASVAAMFERTVAELGPIDVLVLNASGGMESGMGEDYAMRLNRDAQVNVLEGALPYLAPGARIVFVTSHQAHFIRTTPTMPEYEPGALSKRAGEDALRAKLPELEAAGFESPASSILVASRKWLMPASRSPRRVAISPDSACTAIESAVLPSAPSGVVALIAVTVLSAACASAHCPLAACATPRA